MDLPALLLLINKLTIGIPFANSIGILELLFEISFHSGNSMFNNTQLDTDVNRLDA